MRFKEYSLNNQTYRVSTLLVWFFVVCGFLFSILAFQYDPVGEAKYYTSCDSTRCSNFFYLNENYCGKDIPLENELCTREFLFKGETLGNPPPFIIKEFYSLFFGMLAFFILLNHFLFNRDFSFKGVLKND